MMPQSPLGWFLLPLCLIAPSAITAAAPFIPGEVLVSDPTKGKILDPEFDTTQSRYCWIDEGSPAIEGDETLWIGYVDPQTGAFDPPDGRGTLVDQGNIVGVTKIGNGCEWTYSADGPQIVYSKSLGSTIRDRSIARAAFASGQWIAGAMDDAYGSYAPIGSLDPGDPDPSVAYQKFVNPSAFGDRTRALYVRSLVDPATETMIPTTDVLFTPGARWIPDSDTAVFTRPMPPRSVPSRQVFSFDRTNNQLEQLTDDPGDKYSASIWNAPEYDGEQLMLALVDEDYVGIYRKTGDQWTQISIVDPPAAGTYIWSPEVFVYEDHSYIVMTTSKSSNQQSREVPTEIWLAGIDPQQPFYRKLSDATRVTRKDPEAFVVGGRWPFSVSGDRSDYTLTEALTVSPDGQLMAIGSSAADPAGGRNAVLVFPLPVIGQNETIATANLSLKVLQNSRPAGVNGDLWALSVSYGDQPIAYLETDADPDPSAVKIADNLLTAGTLGGQEITLDQTGTDALASFLTSFYSNNPAYQGGAFLNLRVNPDQDTGVGDEGWVIASADHRTEPGPTLTLETRDDRDSVGDPSDYSLSEAGLAKSTDRFIQVGSNADGPAGDEGRNAVLVFELPPIAANETVTAASVGFVVSGVAPVAGVNGDLWAIGIAGLAAPFLDYLEADADPNPYHLRIADNILTATTATGGYVVVAGEGTRKLAEYVMDFYRADPDYEGGAYLYLRLNPDGDTGTDSAGWSIRSAENAAGLQPTMRLSITPRDRAWVYVSHGAKIYRLDTGLDKDPR